MRALLMTNVRRPNVVAVFIAVVLVAPLLWMVMDSAPPYQIVDGYVVPDNPVKNSSVEIRWDVTPLSSCAPQRGASVTRTIVDSKGVAHKYAPVPATYGTNEQFRQGEPRVSINHGEQPKCFDNASSPHQVSSSLGDPFGARISKTVRYL